MIEFRKLIGQSWLMLIAVAFATASLVANALVFPLMLLIAVPIWIVTQTMLITFIYSLGTIKGTVSTGEAFQKFLQEQEEEEQDDETMDMYKLSGGGPLDGVTLPGPPAVSREFRQLISQLDEGGATDFSLRVWDDEQREHELGKYVLSTDADENVLLWMPVEEYE